MQTTAAIGLAMGISIFSLSSCAGTDTGYRTPFGGMMGQNSSGMMGETRQDAITGGRGMMGNSVSNAGSGGIYDFDTGNLPEASATKVVDLKDGDTYDIGITAVKKNIAGKEVTMLAYNGSVPGPTIRAPKGATVKIRLTDNLKELGSTLHSHGVRLEDAFDGVPAEQGGKTAVSINGSTVEYSVKFPDSGLFWYHPHVRDDVGQGMGLYGNYVISDTASGVGNPVNKDEYVILSDVLIKDGKVAPYFKNATDHALMGRYGNVLLTNGSEYSVFSAKKGDVVRFWLTNAASARTFRFGIDGAKLKLVGSDMGTYAHETSVDSVIVGPAERYVVEAYFPNAGKFAVTHTTPDRTYRLGEVNVSETPTDKDYSKAFETLSTNAGVVSEMAKFEPYYAKKADKNLTLSLSSNGMGGMDSAMPGMGDMMDGRSDDGLEWEDTMGAMNTAATSDTIKWLITDSDTGKSNGDIDWKFGKGDLVKIRVFNDPKSMHPMQHPFHVHGQRFVVLSEDGNRNGNPVWKDTVLIPAGKSVDILVDMSNPGKWMAHCHVTEHLHSGMMFGFEVK